MGGFLREWRSRENQVVHVAKLARLALTEDELERLGGQLDAILDAVSKVSELDLSDVPPTSHPLDLVNVLADDEPRPSLPREAALANAPQAEDGAFRVPPDMIDTLRLSAEEALRDARARRRERQELHAAYAARDDDVHAYLSRLDYEGAEGIPIALKDVIGTKGVETTAGSKILEGYVPVYDSTVASRVKNAGLSLLGKTNTDEFAMGSSTENSAFGPSLNPWDPTRVPGGSGGGSAAAVAAGLAPWALGSDTGGSIKQPAALCGIVGLRPTYGTVSRYGIVAFASSLDQVGPTREDRARHRVAVSHHRRARPVRLDHGRGAAGRAAVGGGPARRPRRRARGAQRGRRNRARRHRRRAPRDRSLHGARRRCARNARCRARVEYGLPCYYLIAPAEASSNLARYDGVRFGFRADADDDLTELYERTRDEGFGDEPKRRIMLGTYALSAGYFEAYYGQAQKVRTLIIREHAELFERFDVLVSPTSPTVAFELGARTANPLAMYLSDLLTIPSCMAGLPGLSIPCGLSEGLPVGLQLVGPQLSENVLFRVGHALERAIGFDTVPERLR